MILRIRDKTGTWRLEFENDITIREVKILILESKGIEPSKQNISKDFLGDCALSDEQSLSSLGIKHGDLLYLSIIDQSEPNSTIKNDLEIPQQNELIRGSGPEKIVPDHVMPAGSINKIIVPSNISILFHNTINRFNF